MRALRPDQYAALLEQYILHLDAEMAALSPSGWPVASLQESYAKAHLHADLLDLWQSSRKELSYQAWQAQKASEYAEKKLAHHYL